MLLLLFVFYSYQAIESIKNKDALLYIIYNFSWVIHVVHAIDWIVNFFHDRKLFVQIFQGYRKFYRYLFVLVGAFLVALALQVLVSGHVGQIRD